MLQSNDASILKHKTQQFKYPCKCYITEYISFNHTFEDPVVVPMLGTAGAGVIDTSSGEPTINGQLGIPVTATVLTEEDVPTTSLPDVHPAGVSSSTLAPELRELQALLRVELEASGAKLKRRDCWEEQFSGCAIGPAHIRRVTVPRISAKIDASLRVTPELNTQEQSENVKCQSTSSDFVPVF
ncbi:hypothetical protein ARMSODRAFT_998929 [Armillaria solidipes]|uniref:Uncharacterized protein n=1 Tax=Armillaria solidipes TaxID=1076256 RepID=A0A2H3CHP4_9AGAR|nr:hypothetical protein ARMSODRAFT_998929 [Armillaria solidipes]